jgi:Fic family protein
MNQFIAGHYIQQEGYQSFYPCLLKNIDIDLNQAKLITKLTDTAFELGMLNGYLDSVPELDLHLPVFNAYEALLSSAIEGIKINIEDLFYQKPFQPENLSGTNSKSREKKKEKTDSYQKKINLVKNYIQAQEWGICQLSSKPVSMGLLQGIHAILFRGAGNENKMPGLIRRSQNYIGSKHLSTARFVPPHQIHLPELIADLDEFLQSRGFADYSRLIQASLSHYQLETIHPFMDGNGRTGRVLIMLELIESRLLKKPILSLSKVLAGDKTIYFYALNRARQKNDLNYWIDYFLSVIAGSAYQTRIMLQDLVQLKNCYKTLINTGIARARLDTAHRLLLSLWSKPVINISEAANILGVSFQTANTLVEDFVGLKILEEKTGGERKRVFVMSEYLSLFEKD